MPLVRRAAAGALLAIAIVLGIALSAGTIRLLPWLLAVDVPLGVSASFARVLAALAVETAVLIGVPVGVAIGTAVFVERGEARALLALGMPPYRVALGAWLVAAVIAASGLVASVAAAGETDAPGRLARSLIESGRDSCEGASTPRAALVPIVHVTWLCFPGRAPRVAGPLPGSAERAWFTATELLPSPDLSVFHLRELRVAGRRQAGMPDLHLYAKQATFAGFSAWARTSGLPAPARATAIAAAAFLIASATSWLLVAGRRYGRLGAAVIATLGALAALAALQGVERARLPAPLLGLVPALGIAAVLLAAAISRGIRAAVVARRPSR
jgi:hypothetical protein